MATTAKRSGLITAAIGTFVAGWGVYVLLELYALETAFEPSVELVSIGAYLLGGIGMLLTGLVTVRESEPDPRLHAWLERLSYGSFGLVLLGVFLPQLL